MLRLFLPQICVHCGAHCDDSDAKKTKLAAYLCTVCLSQFHQFHAPAHDDLSYHSSLFSNVPFEVNINAAFHFHDQDIIQSLIHHFKYQEMPKLAIALGAVSGEKNLRKEHLYDFLVPVPLHRTRYSERGYNQSEMLAQGMKSASSVSVARRAWLKRIRQTPTQTGLTLEQRENNVRGAFALTPAGKEKLQGKRLLVIDDVMTTGATLASAAHALAEAKPKQVDIFAFAAVTT